jgi:hypothetical protein
MANWRKEQASYILEDKLLTSGGILNFALCKSKFGNRESMMPCLHVSFSYNKFYFIQFFNIIY